MEITQKFRFCETCNKPIEFPFRKTQRFCSEKCRRKNPPLKYIFCKECGIEFPSKSKSKKYCTLMCFRTSKEFLEGRKKAAKAAAVTKIANSSGQKKTCLNCKKKNHVSPSNLARQKNHFCNKVCYRKYMASRFDRFIANPEGLALPQNYDEFLTQNRLSCLIEGCSWKGINLTLHANLAHGIPAIKFKELGQFNRKTGIVVAELSMLISSRAKDPKNLFASRRHVSADHYLKFRKGLAQYLQTEPKMRLEAKEHMCKAAALKQQG